MCGNKYSDSTIGSLINQLPELHASSRINSSGRFIKEDYFRLMEDRDRKGQFLFPTQRKVFQEGKVIKICGDKIYRFYSQQHFSKITGKHLQPQTTCNYLQELLEDMQGSDDQDDPFTQLIGFDGSLRNAILSAKAGILYPGGALHTLLLGERGVGKSLFAEKIFMYGKKHGIFNKDGQFVVFNCADYANNAELLLSHLFGSKIGRASCRERVSDVV